MRCRCLFLPVNKQHIYHPTWFIGKQLQIIFPLISSDPPKIDADALSKFSEPVIVKAGENASFKLPFSGKEPVKIQWFKEEEELLEGHGVRIEKSSAHSRLLLTKCQRKDTGEIKIKIKNEFATVEATSKLTVLGMYCKQLQKMICESIF